MSRFRQADDQTLPFSQARPDRFTDRFEEYLTPDDPERAVDDAPERDDRGPPVFANVGFAHLKRR